MEKLIANLSSKVQRRTLQGREYLVAPVSMLVEGVFSGSAGPVFYDSTELAKSVAAWNARPIVMGHPELPNGTKVSGCTPEALEKVGVGMILNTKFNRKSKKLVAEAWFDVSQLSKVPDGQLVANALAEGTKLEVSTGLFVDASITTGVFNGAEYTRKAVNFQPDHLAIILNGVGACSVADGAGLFVNQRHEPDKVVSQMKQLFPGHRMCEYDTFKGRALLTNSENNKNYLQNFAVENEVVKLVGELIEVNREVVYTPVVNEQTKMNREQLLAELGEAHKDFVANMSDEQLTAILGLKATPAPVQAPALPVFNSLSDVAEYAPHLKPQIDDAMANSQRVRSGFVSQIVANKANTFSEDDLNALPTETLEKMARLAQVVEPVAQPVTNSAVKPAPVYAPSPVAHATVTEKGFALPSTL